MAYEKSPYLKATDRLADVIAAIQAMGTYKFYKLSFAKWSDRIYGDESKADHWKQVFKDHPEFFRLDSRQEKASLVWRRQHQKLFDVDKEVKIKKEEFKRLSDSERKRISRLPLESNELATLISTAIDLHSRALESKKDNRWWLTSAIALAGVILGAAIKHYIS